MEKTNVIQVRITKSEQEGFKRAAEISGIGLSAWARQKLRSAAIRDLQEVGEAIKFLEPINLKRTNGK